MKKSVIFFLLLLITAPSFSQGTAGDAASYEYRSLIDMPTAGVLKKGFFSVSTDVQPLGVLIARLEVGVFEDLSFGISYGGSNLIGTGSPKWYKLPAASIRYRIIGESVTFPAFTLGFDTQGKGEYFDDDDRYAIKSPGLFLASMKNFAFLGFLSFHATMNYSLERYDGDNFVNLQVGAEKTIGSKVSLIAEYDFAFNDNQSVNFGSGSGYMNLGVRWSVSEGFTLGFDLRDLLSNKKWYPGAADRAIRLEYIKSI
ncbi:MAG: hypothetical protein AMXMBFR48_19600 [Ignavibacteriales bacterium]